MKKFFLRFISLYKKYLSPNIRWFRPLVFLDSSCKFIPTCSDYSYDAIKKYGIIKGLFLGLRRILRCHPFAKGGIDLVP